MSIPCKQECFYILEMIESGLIDFSYINPWADQIIEEEEKIPSWLCDLALKKYRGDLTNTLREYIFSEPFESCPPDLEKFHLACLWLRYERREISWATFLENAGIYLDAANEDWDCETPYHFLNIYKDAYFTEDSERDTKEKYLNAQDLSPWIDIARKKFEPFYKLRRNDKSKQ
jgi:hypothetical protein